MGTLIRQSDFEKMDSDSKEVDLRLQLRLLNQTITDHQNVQHLPFVSKIETDALEVLAGSDGRLSFKVDTWTNCLSLTDAGKQAAYTGALLLLSSQADKLLKISYDPLDMRITKAPVESEDEEIPADANSSNMEETEKINMKIETADTEPHPEKNVETLNVKVERIKDETNTELQYLDWYPALNLKKHDFYKPRFCTYRKSSPARQENILKSSRLLHVRKLAGIDVYDFGFTFNKGLLEKVAPHLEDLQIYINNYEDFSVLQDIQMPKLRRLDIWLRYWTDKCVIEDYLNPFLFPSLPEGHCGLKWLRVRVAKETLISLLNAHSHTLQELQLGVGTPSTQNTSSIDSSEWPFSCCDLHTLLEGCQLRVLKRLLLIREGCKHSSRDCRFQINRVRRKLSGVIVQCGDCSNILNSYPYKYEVVPDFIW